MLALTPHAFAPWSPCGPQDDDARVLTQALSPLLLSGKVDFSAYKKGVKSATMRMFFGSLDQHDKSEGVITMEEWLKIMGQLSDKVKENPDPHHAQTTHLSNALGSHIRHAHAT